MSTSPKRKRARLFIPQEEEHFQIIYLTSNDESIDVVEAASIDFEKAIAYVLLGGSFFITSKV